MPYNVDCANYFRMGEPTFVSGLRDLIAQLPDGLVMAEVGVYAGASTCIFLSSGKVNLLFAVDQWRDYAENGILKTFPYRWCDVRDTFTATAGRDARVRVLETDSARAARLVPDAKLDFVYIDANHDYEHVKADIAAWRPKIAPGGCIGGHDYGAAFPGVMRAVAEMDLGAPVTFADTSWLLRVPV